MKNTDRQTYRFLFCLLFHLDGYEYNKSKRYEKVNFVFYLFVYFFFTENYSAKINFYKKNSFSQSSPCDNHFR